MKTHEVLPRKKTGRRSKEKKKVRQYFVAPGPSFPRDSDIMIFQPRRSYHFIFLIIFFGGGEEGGLI
jgi:hypothetical protein